jgi:excisionase family DNA binding protein
MENKDKKRVTIAELGDVVSVQELASLLGVSTRLIYGMASKGEIKSFKFNSLRLFLKKDVLELIGYEEAKPAVVEVAIPARLPDKSITASEFEPQKKLDSTTVVVAIPPLKAGGYKGGLELGA